jgi:hypothetical protein
MLLVGGRAIHSTINGYKLEELFRQTYWLQHHKTKELTYVLVQIL